ncbi:hypothetical protein M0R72_20880 [Candidatus Pacearchaeota archaeon]|jgi:hypothetical protein|nr:hypothetical protein [Candidatus Pacearchaeota archaeon]
MDTITKIILGALAAVFSACATIIYIVTRDGAITMAFAGMATSCVTGLAGISYGSRLSAISGELITNTAVAGKSPIETPPPATTPPA